ncbi:MAG: ROK family protein [Candidatus Bathyarchaeia archaeon]
MKKLAIGVDLGGTNVRIALGKSDGQFLARLSEETEKKKGPEGVSKQIIKMIRSLLGEKFSIKDVQGIGIGSTGPLNLDKGGLMKPTNIPYDFVPLVKPLEDEFRLPVYLMNDCVSAVVGEKYFGAGREHENLVYITLSTGIGGGIYVNNHLLIGKDGNAHEIGHFTIDYEGRLQCNCGKRGHWEGYCSGEGIPNFVELLLKDKKPKEIEGSSLAESLKSGQKISAKTLYDAAKSGDQLANELVEKIGVLNAIGFACVVDAYDPSLITVGGTIALKNTELVLDPIKRHIEEHARNRVPEIILTSLGDDIGLYGALAKVFH